MMFRQRTGKAIVNYPWQLSDLDHAGWKEGGRQEGGWGGWRSGCGKEGGSVGCGAGGTEVERYGEGERRLWEWGGEGTLPPTPQNRQATAVLCNKPFQHQMLLIGGGIIRSSPEAPIALQLIFQTIPRIENLQV